MGAGQSVELKTILEARRGKLLTAVFIMCALCAGMLAPTQALINGSLSTALNDPYSTAVISFITGLLILVVIMGCSMTARAGLHEVYLATRAGSLPRWSLLSGAMGATFVLSQAVTIPLLGVAVFTVVVVVGQVLTSVFVDAIGLGGMPRRKPTPTRLLGACGIILAAVITSLSVSGATASPATYLFALLLPLIAGGLLSVQMVSNGIITRVGGTLWPAVFLNFVIGAVVLLVVWVCTRQSYSGVVGFGPIQEWWLYIGGALGIAMVAAQARLVGVIGALLFSLALITGQLLGSLGLAAVFQAAGSVSGYTIVGVIVAFISVTIGSQSGGKKRK